MSETLRAIAKITNKRGLHARASAKVVEASARFQSEITIIKDGTRVNGRSIMGLMMLAASLGSEIGVEVKGPDAEAAMTAMLSPRGRRWLGRKAGTDRIFLDYDASARAAYEQRAQSATGLVSSGREPNPPAGSSQ